VRALPATERQLDELWSVVHTKQPHLAMAKRVCDTYGDAWSWTDLAPVWRMVLAVVVQNRLPGNTSFAAYPGRMYA
jgi:hypothetical protein